MVLSKDFREFIAALNAHEVQYLIVGGYAVGFHGYPRYTKDLDVWIRILPENAEALIHALTDFGFGSVGLTATDFLNPNELYDFGEMRL